MSKSGWRYRIAAGLTAAVLGVLIWSVFNYQTEQTIDRGDAAKARSDYTAYEDDCKGLVPPGPMVSDCLIKQVQAAHQEKHAESDLRAQQAVAVWTYVLMILGIVGTLLSAAGVGLLIWTFSEQRKLTRRQMRADVTASVRGYIAEWHGIPHLIGALENVGETEAHDIETLVIGEFRDATSEQIVGDGFRVEIGLPLIEAKTPVHSVYWKTEGFKLSDAQRAGVQDQSLRLHVSLTGSFIDAFDEKQLLGPYFFIGAGEISQTDKGKIIQFQLARGFQPPGHQQA